MAIRHLVQGHPWLQRSLALAAVFALLQPALVVFDVNIAGWRPDHEHFSISAAPGTVPAHEHPYDHAHASEHSHGANAADGEGDDVVFLSSDDATAAAIPAANAVALTPHLAPPSAETSVRQGAPSGVSVVPPSPPPRI